MSKRLCPFCSDDGQWSTRHSFTFSGQNCPQGIAAIVHHPAHNLLIVGGHGQWEAQNQNSKTATAMEYGITAWRVLSGAPYYKMVMDYEHDLMTVRLIYCNSVTTHRFQQGLNSHDLNTFWSNALKLQTGNMSSLIHSLDFKNKNIAIMIP